MKSVLINKIFVLAIILFYTKNLFASRDYRLNFDTGERTPLEPFEFNYAEKLEVIQPDGVEISINQTAFFLDRYSRYSGYSFKCYTAILDTLSNYWCYAQRGEDGWLESTGFPVHLFKGADLGLDVLIRPSQEREKEIIQREIDNGDH
jgi:hypothetical protein